MFTLVTEVRRVLVRSKIIKAPTYYNILNHTASVWLLEAGFANLLFL